MNSEDYILSPPRGVEVNTIKIYDDDDFKYAKSLCESRDWTQVYRKKATTVWVRKSDSDFDAVRAKTEYGFSSELLYDVLQDNDFRSKWDRLMLESVNVGFISPNHDVYYYAMSCSPFKGRDFVIQRAWLDQGYEKIICAHSVSHRDYPATNHVRGIVYITVYFVRALSKDTCQLTYVTHSDPKGKLPAWLINKVTTVLAPQVFKRLEKACREYPEWKASQNNPNWKPWRFTDQQLEWPKINVGEMCKPTDYQQDVPNESRLNEPDDL